MERLKWELGEEVSYGERKKASICIAEEKGVNQFWISVILDQEVTLLGWELGSFFFFLLSYLNFSEK